MPDRVPERPLWEQMAERSAELPQGERLQIATTVFSSQVSYPFTLDKVYRRFDPSVDGITCKQTLNRGRVCTTEQSP